MARFVLPKTHQARNWVRSTDALRKHLLERKATIGTRAAALRRQAEAVEREAAEIEGGIALLDQLLPAKPGAQVLPSTPADDAAPTSPKRWSLMHDACVKCGRSEVKHMARGLCGTCYTAEIKAKAAA